ncbi:MAG: 2,3-bisphosphoglycerate-independent phosphoglycerate mutase [Gaiellaceae bacterium MAG52_C11]|nr:2,3-bisphosphoglycerate-independent phosphoglycerate mutase [Candidatus Gaiellasilicea maunaloa]
MPGRFPLVTLIVLDGWGCASPGPGNAVELADTPVFDRLWREYPHTTLVASGEVVGLPPGQMGNSEVGHLTIGSGRILFQDLMRVNQAVRDGSLFENEALVAAFERARARGGDIHLLGLVSTGGVHSHLEHLRALLELARRLGMEERTWIHAFTDGRDVSPTSAVADLATLPPERIATIVGRYYAMDRDKRWDRTERALAAIVAGEGQRASDPIVAAQASYDTGLTDEFVEPIVLSGRPRLTQKDAAIFFNFRPDRGRQLSRKLVAAGFDLTTMTSYGEELDVPVAFGDLRVPNTLAETLSNQGARQLHAAETEKYAHVTYFFNGGVEQEWKGETRILVPSPRDVPSYDHKPEMSAREVAQRFAAEIVNGYRFAVVNFANPDMVGHTGSIPAVVEAVEVTDECLGVVVEATHATGGVCLVTADHGNAEQMLEPDGISPQTAHTTNPVPLVLTSMDARLAPGGGLADLAPTALRLLGLEPPAEMTGGDLSERTDPKASSR